MSKEIREQIDKVKNWKQFLNENIGAESSSGINFLYQQYPELTNVGTQEQYSQYLDTIFPNSKIREILYHRSSQNFDAFDKSKAKSQTKRFYFICI